MKFAILLLGLSLAAGCSMRRSTRRAEPVGCELWATYICIARIPKRRKKFWVDALDAQETKLGGICKCSSCPEFWSCCKRRTQRAGTEGSVINHIGFKVRDLSATLAKLEAAHIPMWSAASRPRPWFWPRTTSAWS